MNLRPLILKNIFFMLAMGEMEHRAVDELPPSLLLPVFADYRWKLLKRFNNVVFFEFRICPSKKIDLKARDPQTPIQTLVAKGM